MGSMTTKFPRPGLLRSKSVSELPCVTPHPWERTVLTGLGVGWKQVFFHFILGGQKPKFESSFCQLDAVCPQVGLLPSLSLHFLIS